MKKTPDKSNFQWKWLGVGLCTLGLLIFAGCSLFGMTNKTAEDSSSSIVSDQDGMTLLYVPAGEFLMGSTEDDPRADDNEFPQHEVYLNDFYIDQTEVTNAQYRLCVQAGECSQPAETEYYDDSQYNEYPVVHVNWYDAQSYCQWAGRELPTEAQWEKAARGTDGRIYPWGNTFEGDLLNFCDKNCEYAWKDLDWDDGYVQTSPVGSFREGASPYGVLDMAGNVSEWTTDWYGEDYYALSPTENPTGLQGGDYKTFRGGSWYHDEGDTRATNRSYINANHASNILGFRCAQSASSTLETPTVTTAESDENVLPASQACQIVFFSDRDGDEEIFVMNADGSNPTQLTSNDSNDGSPAWSPDGKYIAFTSDRDGDYEIFVMEVDGSNPTQLTFNDSADVWPAWSPDRKRITFFSDRDGDYEIFMMDADGSNPTQLTFNDSNDWGPVWSPDGKHITFFSDRDGDHEIFVIDADGSNPTQLTFNDSNDWWPVWSPDGNHIAFNSRRDGDSEIFVMDADGSNTTQLTFNDSGDWWPAWSSDGKHIAFISERDGDDEIFVMDTDGGNPTQLTFNDSVDDSPAWSPLCVMQLEDMEE